MSFNISLEIIVVRMKLISEIVIFEFKSLVYSLTSVYVLPDVGLPSTLYLTEMLISKH